METNPSLSATLRGLACSAVIVTMLLFDCPGYAQQFRGTWADGWGNNFHTAAQTTQLISDARSANFNAVVVEIRKRGDAYYNSHIEPLGSGVSSDYDPLDDMVTQAHDTSNGRQRVEVHAWFVTYMVGNGAVYQTHPDWWIRDAGGKADTNNFIFDPGHPAVQQYTFNVAMDIITNYAIDGFSFDYIRYMGNTWGYNTNSVARFNARYGLTGQPSATNALWLQFRRDQVTALVRKIYLNAIAVKPMIKISANTITWSPGPADSSRTAFEATSAWTSVLQDSRGWMEEGIVDYNMPMSYFRQTVSAQAADYLRWINFVKDNQFNRQAVILPGGYLNFATNAIYQMRLGLASSPAGNAPAGVGDYDYGTPSTNVARATFFPALVSPSIYDTNPTPIFATRMTPPPMPWKVSPTKGHLKGFIYGGTTNNPLDGANFTLSGPVTRANFSDATGFYGVVDLPPGIYTLTASSSVYGTGSAIVAISTNVATCDLILGAPPVPPSISSQPQSQTAMSGTPVSLNVGATGSLPLNFQWRLAGQPINGATDSALNFAAIQLADAGNYDVIVSNNGGAVTSALAVVAVAAPPPGQFIGTGHAANGQFQFSYSGDTAAFYLLEVSSNLTQWLPLTTLDGAGPGLFADSLNWPQRFYRGRTVSTVTLADFEDYSSGSSALFQRPAFSGTTLPFIDTAAANFAMVTNSFPPNHAGSKVLQVSWTFKSGTTNPWLRLTTSDPLALQNPTIDFRQAIQFDVFADKEIYLALGLRETGPAAVIGADGGRTNSAGVSYPIEWVGGATDNSTAPPKGHWVPGGQWTTLRFFLPYEPIKSFTGNGILDSAAGKGVLEHLAITPGSAGAGAYKLYLDNVTVFYLSP